MIYGRVSSWATQSDMTRTIGNCVTKTGEKKTRLCCASAALLLLLCLTKIGGLDPNNEIQII